MGYTVRFADAGRDISEFCRGKRCSIDGCPFLNKKNKCKIQKLVDNKGEVSFWAPSLWCVEEYMRHAKTIRNYCVMCDCVKYKKYEKQCKFAYKESVERNWCPFKDITGKIPFNWGI